MKNVNYNLLKLLHLKLDNVWRLEKFYIDDAKQANCHSIPLLEKILESEKSHVESLKEEIKMRMDAKIFD